MQFQISAQSRPKIHRSLQAISSDEEDDDEDEGLEDEDLEEYEDVILDGTQNKSDLHQYSNLNDSSGRHSDAVPVANNGSISSRRGTPLRLQSHTSTPSSMPSKKGINPRNKHLDGSKLFPR